MSRLTSRFELLRRRGEKALVCFVTAGDPSAEATVDIVAALDRAGVDAVEIGIPFSDPMADGPSIQAASQRALESGMTTAKTLDIVRAVRAASPDLPLILMTYYNPVRHFGIEAFAQQAAGAGADATIVTDLTPEEAGDWKRVSAASGLDTIFLAAPTSTPERVAIVCRASTGFVYCVSRTGVTGAQQELSEHLDASVSAVRAHTQIPVCIGFGISTPDHVRTVCRFADGAIVGSALVNLIDRDRCSPHLLENVCSFAASLKAATRGV